MPERRIGRDQLGVMVVAALASWGVIAMACKAAIALWRLA